jgi:hypothetical protein
MVVPPDSLTSVLHHVHIDPLAGEIQTSRQVADQIRSLRKLLDLDAAGSRGRRVVAHRSGGCCYSNSRACYQLEKPGRDFHENLPVRAVSARTTLPALVPCARGTRAGTKEPSQGSPDQDMQLTNTELATRRKPYEVRRRARLGLASGLALAVRPAGLAEVSGVNGAP